MHQLLAIKVQNFSCSYANVNNSGFTHVMPYW